MSWLKGHRPVYSHADMKRLVDPHSIAIVGLSRNEASFGARTARNLVHFKGNVYGVNPKADEIHGVKCFPSLSAIPEAVDCAVIAVPLDAVESIMEECASAKVGGVVIYASGFAETGLPERIALQNRLLDIARHGNMRMVGPNCMGLINNVSKAGLSFSATYGARLPATGPVGLVSQSGGLGQAVAQVSERGGAYSHFMAAGNSADVDVCDYISYLAEDPTCKVIACVAEGLKDGERFLEAGERALKFNKPIVMYKIATGQAAAKAAMSHTGTLAGANAAYDAAYRRLGIVKVDNIEDLYETSSFLAKAGRPKAAGVAAVAASGGACVITLDKAESFGVPMPKPAADTQAVLDATVPDFGAPGNPCDITAQVATNPASYATCAEALLKDPNYAALVIMAPSINPAVTPRNVQMFSGLAAAAGKPVCLSWISEWLCGPGSAEAEADPHVALFQSTQSCYRTLAAWLQREQRITGPAPRKRNGQPSASAAKARALLDRADARLSEREAKEIIAAYGVPVAQDRVVQTADVAVAAARTMGFPVVLKVESPDIAHKTEAGVVRLNVKDEAAVKQAFNDIMANANRVEPKPKIAGVLVQPMIPSGIELVVGAQVDPTFGPTILVGMGGIMVELLKDSALELAPVNKAQAHAMLESLKGYKLLQGFRGAAGVDIDRIADIIVSVSEFAADFANEVAEVDINPIICAPDRIVAVDALIIRTS